jgi:hypothetical protein
VTYIDASVFERLVNEVNELRDRIDRQSRTPQESGVVTAVDTVSNRVTVDVGGSVVYPNLPPGGVFLPKVGEKVTVWYSGAAVVVLPQGASLFSSHNFDPLDPTNAGWGMDTAGNLWANDGHFRGIVEASTIKAGLIVEADEAPPSQTYDAEAAYSAVDPLPNGSFDVNANDWTGVNCTIARITGSPTPQAGAGALSLTRVGTPTEMYAQNNTFMPIDDQDSSTFIEGLCAARARRDRRS